MLHDAIYELYEDAVSIKGNTVETVEVFDENGDAITIVDDDVTAKITELENANEYKQARAFAYPSIQDQLDEIFHNGIDSWKAIIQQVKDDNPKPSE